ncbi:glycosyltransferase family 25 protein [Pseudescherichia sp.]|uniref:glycosyltransferase family 25 protein n=1 Tax=Pseudescherichia sp. TaxID=2055881 RepID=UPI0028AB26CC|nr:glycosyltransferase family 25 protein [Pseudescherichia sp.]
MSIDWSVFDKIIYINLKERHDRRSSIEKELQLLGVADQKIHRLDAKRHLIGQIGCAQSHLEAIETAITQGWGNILILEDDMIFNKDPDAIARLSYFLHALKRVRWQAALLSANYRKVVTFKTTDKLIRPLDALCCCAYAVQADYRATLQACFAGAVERLRKGGGKYDHAVDMAWLPLMQQHAWLGMYPVAGHQAPGKSDIENGIMDSTNHFYKALAEIAQ